MCIFLNTVIYQPLEKLKMKIKVIKIGKTGKGNSISHLHSGKSVVVVTDDKLRNRVIKPKVLKVAVFEKWTGERFVCVCGGRDTYFKVIFICY